jgi:hypothetical protein
VTSTQPDWDSLADINFLIRRRLAEHLNAAVGAVNLIDTPEAGARPAEFWKAHAIRHIMRAQHMYEAWSLLIRYKSGQRLAQGRRFRAGDLLEWLASETFQTYIAHPDHERVLAGNRETLQEALLLIHSAAYSLGPHVRLLTEYKEDHCWFRVRFQVNKLKWRTLDELLEQLGDDWRSANAGFELHRAQDFLEMNGCALSYRLHETAGELSFSVALVSAGAQHEAIASAQSDDETIPTSPANDETQPAGEDIRRRFSKRIQANQPKPERFSRSE